LRSLHFLPPCDKAARFPVIPLIFLQRQQQVEMEQTSTKLRKTFRYPTDNDSDDDLPEALDEEGMFPIQ
jgi:hypothetical protein